MLTLTEPFCPSGRHWNALWLSNESFAGLLEMNQLIWRPLSHVNVTFADVRTRSFGFIARGFDLLVWIDLIDDQAGEEFGIEIGGFLRHLLPSRDNR